MDRLRQLQACAADSAASQTPPPSTSCTTVPVVRKKSDLTAQERKRARNAAAFRICRELADRVRSTIALIERTTEELQQVQEERKGRCMGNSHAEKLSAKTQVLSERISQLAIDAKRGLDAMSKNTATLKETQDSIAANSAIIRIEENQYTHLVLKLTTAMAEYERHQSANEAFYKAQTQRQIKIKYTNPDGSAIDDATAAQLAEQVMENNTTSYIFQQSKDVLASIIETRNDIYRIEQSMRDLNQLFNDLAFLVHEQGELMDVILANIQQSTRYVEKGRAELKKARKYQRSIRRKNLGIGAVAGVSIAAITVGAVAPIVTSMS